MVRSTSLSPSHYAGKWRIPSDEQLNDLSEVNQLGLEYAKMEDCPAKEELLLKVVEMFHGFLMKYLTMILRGTLPPLASRAGREAKMMLTLLIDRKTEVNKDTLNAACKMLHLAFKQMSTEEIYDTLALCLMRAARQYDPYYTDKMKSVCEAINGLPKQFNPEHFKVRMGFDCGSFLRVLVKKGYLTSITKTKKVVAYRRASAWPPPEEFFRSGPIGFVYVLNLWFRWFFREFIASRMDETEALEGVLQLDHCRPNYARLGERVFPDIVNMEEFGLPHVDGNILTTYGNRVKADTRLMNLSLDLSDMTLEWVAYTDDKVFRNLTSRERLLLYMVWVEEKTWKQIAKALDCDLVTVKRRLDEVLQYLIMRMKRASREEAQRVSAEIIEALNEERKRKKPKKLIPVIAASV